MLSIFKSKGIKRSLASALAFAAMVAPSIPAVAPYAELLSQLAGILGGAGLLHAGVSKASS